MNRILKQHVPVRELPKSWQMGLPADALVDVEIIQVSSGRSRPIAALVGAGRNVHGTEEEAIAGIRDLRNDN